MKITDVIDIIVVTVVKMALAGSWSDVGGAHIQAFTFSSQDHGRLSGVWCGVCGSDDSEHAVSVQGHA